MSGLEGLREASVVRQRAAEALADAIAAQHEQIRAARADRWPVVTIAQTAGLSRMSVHRVLTQADQD